MKKKVKLGRRPAVKSKSPRSSSARRSGLRFTFADVHNKSASFEGRPPSPLVRFDKGRPPSPLVRFDKVYPSPGSAKGVNPARRTPSPPVTFADLYASPGSFKGRPDIARKTTSISPGFQHSNVFNSRSASFRNKNPLRYRKNAKKILDIVRKGNHTRAQIRRVIK